MPEEPEQPPEQEDKTRTEIEALVQEFGEIYSSDKMRPQILSVDEAMQKLHQENEEINILEYAIERQDEETQRILEEIQRYMNMIVPLKQYEEKIMPKRDFMEDIMQTAQKSKRDLITETAISDLNIIEGVNKMVNSTNIQSKRPIIPEIKEQIRETIQVNEVFPIIPEKEEVVTKIPEEI
jgi:hypothetical protein